MELVTLRTMCELLNVSRRSIQGYEKAGLMKPTGKNKYGHLLYDQETLHRTKMIKFLQQLGFRVRDIKEIIDAADDVKKEALKKRIEELENEKNRMDWIIREAKAYVDAL